MALRLTTATCLAALAASLAAPGAAQAQFFFDTWGGRFSVPLDEPYERGYEPPYRDAAPISRGEITAMLSRRGYRVTPSIARNNDVYLVNAVDPSGRRMRLVVDAYDGTILRRTEASAAAPPRAASRFDDEDRWLDGEALAPPPRVIPGVGPAQRKPAPQKPTTARVEPRAPAKSVTPQPAPAPATPPATAPAPATPGPAAAVPAKPAPETRAEAPAPAPTVIPAPPAATEPAPSGPRVIPLYKKPPEGAAADKPEEGPP